MTKPLKTKLLNYAQASTYLTGKSKEKVFSPL